MSQFFIGTSAGSLPPSVPTSFVTDVNSPSVPLANVENIIGGTSTVNNNTGIQTDGSSGSNTITIQLTNRFQNTVTTTDGTPTAISTFPLGATPGVYTFDVNIAGYDLTDSLGLGFSLFGTVRTTGAAGTVCGTVDKIVNEEAAPVFPCNATIVASGNNAIIQVTGVAGKTIHWNSTTTYIFVS
jgi:hypothetical protein